VQIVCAYATKITVEQARVELAYGNDPRVALITGDTYTAPTWLGKV
jgi:hypothetical protein